MRRFCPPAPTGYRPLAMALLWLPTCVSSLAAQKQDFVTLTNGDRIRGEVKELSRGRLKYKTDPAGTLYFQWDSVASFTSRQQFEVEIADGVRLFGRLDPVEGEPRFRLIRAQDTVLLAKPAIVGITPVKGTFWARWDGNIDVSFNFTQARTSVYWSLNGSASYRTRYDLIKLSAGSFIQTQDSVSTTSRDNFTGSYSRYFKRNWFAIGTISFEQNSDLSLDYRLTPAAGGGRTLVHTNKTLMYGWIGLAANREKFADTDPDSNLDAVIAWNYALFTYAEHKTDLTASVAVLPSLTIGGRYRITADAKFKREFFKDFYLTVGFFETFDSKPQGVDARKNDFGVNTGLGWSF